MIFSFSAYLSEYFVGCHRLCFFVIWGIGKRCNQWDHAICLNFLLGVIDYAFLLYGALEIVVINGIMRSLKLSSKPMNDLVEEGT